MLALVITAFAASSVTAGNPASVNPGGFPGNNTPFPVTVGTYLQIKGAGAPPLTGGGLAVREFIAWANASFSGNVGIQGILTGKPVSATLDEPNSNLLFGKASLNNRVDVFTTGWTYARNGWIYTPVQNAAPGTHQPLCANTLGQIIICPGVPPYTPPPFTP